ncbi:hypothetical protein PCANC_08940 [Puccinia coronata f. sp. avenae]|uniref:Uncharacterized protein n=1 Tax=Puccinia coronata f. sp. avenae TaxID=200324 RepID=A0A2N5T2F9_9BASI|nr:hypothetical protein PCANC_08940 [Puccinia coronata f. sp. avenae]
MSEQMHFFGSIPPLPFANAPNGSQESWLGPSQTQQQGLFRLFYEPTQQPTNGHAGIPSANATGMVDGNHTHWVGNHTSNGNTSGEPVPGHPVPLEVIYETPKAIHINYTVFKHAVSTPAPSKSQSKNGPIEWDKLTPPLEIVWKTPIFKWAWADFQLEVIQNLDKARNHIGEHIRVLEKDNLLKWKCALVQHQTYGVKANYIPTSNAKFHAFLEAIRLSPTSKILIRLVMEDPVIQAKKLELEKAQNQSLALSYGPEEERAGLERAMFQSALNPQADQGASECVDMVHQLTMHIMDTYGCNTKSLRIQDLEDPKRSIRIAKPQLLVWSRALMHGAEGVDFNTPPRGNFPSEPKKVFTEKERQAVPKQFAPVRCTPSGRWVYPQKFNPPTLSADAPSPLTLKAFRASGIGSPQAGTLFPKATPTQEADLSSGEAGMEDKYPSNIGALNDAELSDYEALLAAGELPNILATKPAGCTPKTAATNPKPSAKLLNSAGVIAKATAVTLTSASKKSKASKAADNTSKARPSTNKNPLCSDSDVECVPPPAPVTNTCPLPGRKYRHHRGTGGDKSLPQLNVNGSDGHKRTRSILPQRKSPNSKQSSARHPGADDLLSSFFSSIGRADSPEPPMDTTCALKPLNEKGLSLSLTEFLGLIGLGAGNRVVWALFELNHIQHWGFFCRATVNQLRRRGFPFPIAGQLIDGARAVEHRFVQAGSPLTNIPAPSALDPLLQTGSASGLDSGTPEGRVQTPARPPPHAARRLHAYKWREDGRLGVRPRRTGVLAMHGCLEGVQALHALWTGVNGWHACLARLTAPRGSRKPLDLRGLREPGRAGVPAVHACLEGVQGLHALQTGVHGQHACPAGTHAEPAVLTPFVGVRHAGVCTPGWEGVQPPHAFFFRRSGGGVRTPFGRAAIKPRPRPLFA